MSFSKFMFPLFLIGILLMFLQVSFWIAVLILIAYIPIGLFVLKELDKRR